MPSPQIENGYTKIANELLDRVIISRLTSNEFTVFLFVLRKTYGWGKKEDRIPLSQFEEGTQLARPTVNKNIKSLVAKQLLVVKQLPSGNLYQIQKDYSLWVTSSRADTSSRLATRVVAKQLPKLVAVQLHSKEKKETIQKKYISISELNDSHFQQISERYSVPISFVRSKYDDMVNWHESSGKIKKDWIATLRNFVKKDALKIKGAAYGKSNIAFVTTK